MRLSHLYTSCTIWWQFRAHVACSNSCHSSQSSQLAHFHLQLEDEVHSLQHSSIGTTTGHLCHWRQNPTVPPQYSGRQPGKNQPTAMLCQSKWVEGRMRASAVWVKRGDNCEYMSKTHCSLTLQKWKLEPRCSMWSPHWCHPPEWSWAVWWLHHFCIALQASVVRGRWRVLSSLSRYRESAWNVCLSTQCVPSTSHKKGSLLEGGGRMWAVVLMSHVPLCSL